MHTAVLTYRIRNKPETIEQSSISYSYNYIVSTLQYHHQDEFSNILKDV